MTTASPQAPAIETRKCLGGCGRTLRSAEAVARGYGSRCWAKVRKAARTADLSAWTPSQVEEAEQAIEDGAVVPSTREGVFHVVSVDGSEVHRTAEHGCNCTSGLKTRQPRPCWHRCAVAIVLATSAPAPRPVLAPAPIAVPAPAAAPDDVWTALEAAGALDLVPAF
jgi:hypothetical protein